MLIVSYLHSTLIKYKDKAILTINPDGLNNLHSTLIKYKGVGIKNSIDSSYRIYIPL